MDIIISANDEVKRMIKEIPLDDNDKISLELFQKMIDLVVNGKKNDEI